MATTNKQIFLSFLAIVCGLLVVAAIRDADAAHSNKNKDLHGGKCPRVKPSCCIMQFVNHEVDADFKDSEECPLDCCAAPGGAGRHDRRLARQFRNRFFDFLQCFSKLLFNFWKPGYSMAESCCTKFMTFRMTPFCRSTPTKSPVHSSTSTTGLPQSTTSTSTKAPSSSQSPLTTTTTTKASDSSSTPSSTPSTVKPASSSSVAPASAAPSGPSTSKAPDSSQTTKEPQTTTKSSVKKKSKSKSHETHSDS